MTTLRERAAEVSKAKENERAIEAAKRLQKNVDEARDGLVLLLASRLQAKPIFPSTVFFDQKEVEVGTEKPQPYISYDGILFTRHRRQTSGYYEEMLLLAWRCPNCGELSTNYNEDVRDLEHLHHALRWADQLSQDPSACPACVARRKEEDANEAEPVATRTIPKGPEHDKQLIAQLVDFIGRHLSQT